MMMGKPTYPHKLYYRIGEVSRITGLRPHVLRYWEQEFKLRLERSGGAQRRYRREDLETILTIKELLYENRFTIAGAKKKIQELRRGSGEPLEKGSLTRRCKEVLREVKKELEEIKGILD